MTADNPNPAIPRNPVFATPSGAPAEAGPVLPNRPGAIDPSLRPGSLQEAAAFYDMEEEEEDTLKDRYLTFRLQDEEYSLEIRNVLEIIGMLAITRIPDMPGFVKGIVNLRGQIIPVMDVRLRFGLPEIPYDERTCIIVVSYRDYRVGLIVDQVRGVRDIPPERISPPPKFSKVEGRNFMAGLGRVDDEVKILLDLKRLLFAGHRQELLEELRESCD